MPPLPYHCYLLQERSSPGSSFIPTLKSAAASLILVSSPWGFPILVTSDPAFLACNALLFSLANLTALHKDRQPFLASRWAIRRMGRFGKAK